MTTSLAEGVFHLRHPLAGSIWCGATMIRGDWWVLVDTGPPNFARRTLAPFLKDHGILPAQIQVVVNTHCHFDHCGGNAGVSALTGARFAAHTCDADLIANPGLGVAALTRRYGAFYPLRRADDRALRRRFGDPIELNDRLDDGQEIDLGSRILRVLHSPGHTWGHLAIWEEATGLLISADAIQGLGTPVQPRTLGGTAIAYYSDVDAYSASLLRLRALGSETIVLGHAFMPFSDSVVQGREAEALFKESLLFIEQLDELLITFLAGHRSHTLPEMTRRVCSELSNSRATFQAMVTVESHLERLHRLGRVMCEAGSRTSATWRLLS